MLVMLGELFKGLFVALVQEVFIKQINAIWFGLFQKKMVSEARKITDAFDLYTNSSIHYSKFQIKNLPHITKTEVSEIISTWEGVDGILLIGEGGSGKSGIARDVARMLRKERIPVLLVYADELLRNQDPAISIEQRLSVNTKLLIAFKDLGQVGKTVFIVDQLDSVAGTDLLEGFSSLMKAISAIPNVFVLGVTRTYEAKEVKSLRNLGFQYIKCDLLGYEETKRYLAVIGLQNPSENIISLGRNLLNLSIIADVISANKDITQITGEIELWLKFTEIINEREGRDALSRLIEIAESALSNGVKEFRLRDDFSIPIIRLIGRGILQPTRTGHYRIFHDRLHEFLCAYSAFSERTSPVKILEIYGADNGRKILFWLHGLIQTKAPKEEAQFIKGVLNATQMPFYIKTSFIDMYLHKSKSELTFDIAEVILKSINEARDVRSYFFRNRPHSDWAQILWEKDFFVTPPIPTPTEDGYILPRWDVQDFLISVANQAPDIVVKHVNSVEGQSWYVSQALHALKEIPVSYVVKTFSRLMQFIEQPSVDRVASEYMYEIMLSFANNNFVDLAFAMFDSMTEPVMVSDEAKLSQMLYKDEAGSKSDAVFADWKNDNLVGVFSNLDPLRTISILDKHLRSSLSLEEKNLSDPYYKKGSWWRASIEDTDQNYFFSYKEKLLQNLRIAIDIQLKKVDSPACELVQNYLVDEMNIFRRIGIHFVRLYPSIFSKELQHLLSNYENLNDYFIHHEFFLLLRDGFIYLDENNQKKLVEKIKLGPPAEQLKNYHDWWKDDHFPKNLNLDEYLKIQTRHWVFGRLWMIQDHLIGHVKDEFDVLFKEMGEPSIPPEFISYSTGISNVEYTSPLSAMEISAFTLPDLIAFLIEWKPDVNRSLRPREQTYSSLGFEVAKAIFENPSRYKDFLFEIAKIKPAYGNAIVSAFSQLEQRTDELWQSIFELSEKLLEFEEVRLANNPSLDDSWYYFKRSLLDLIRKSFSDQQKMAPGHLLSKIKNILLVLINDPDPSNEHNKPPKDNSTTSDDPSHIALNSIRPTAVNTLITCVMEEYKVQNKDYSQDLGIKRMPLQIQNILAAKLDANNESSWAVRSVFGERLINLFWLDKEWTELNLEKIFPQSDDEESRWLFSSAASSYVVFRNFFPELFTMLKPVYERAIDLFSKGYIWKTHLQSVSHLAGHVVWSYLEFDGIVDFYRQDDGSLVSKFFSSFDSDGRKDGALICRRILDFSENVDKYWGKLRDIWEWRAREALLAGNTNDFDREMLHFIQFVSVAPETETVQSLWTLLTSSVPHFHRMQYRDTGWDGLEDFLAKRVNAEPLLAIKLYSMMYEYAMPPKWLEKRDEARKIIETAVKDERSKQVACDLINFIGSRLEDDRYRDLYEKYC